MQMYIYLHNLPIKNKQHVVINGKYTKVSLEVQDYWNNIPPILDDSSSLLTKIVVGENLFFFSNDLWTSMGTMDPRV